MKQILLLSILFCSVSIWGQEPLKVYFSTANFPTAYDSTSFLRAEFQEVAFVRDRKLCDVQVLEIHESAGLDATRVKLIIAGYEQFKGQNDTLFFFINPAENPFSIREKRLETLKEGLLPYLLQTEWTNSLYFSPKTTSGSRFQSWDAKLFGISADGGFFGGNSKIYADDLLTRSNDSKSSTYQVRVDMAKVTEKRRFGGYLRTARNESNSEIVVTTFSIDPNGTLIPLTTTTEISNVNKLLNYNLFYAQALNKHFSIGGQFNGSKFSSNNVHRTSVNVGGEYSFYPYTEWFERHLVLRYGLGKQIQGPLINSIYASDKFDHNLSLFYQKRHKWGVFSTSAFGTAAFNNDYWTAWETGISVSADFEVGRGLFFSTSIQANRSNRNYSVYSNAPIYSKAYRYSFRTVQFGLTYLFGTPWRTIVNPRTDQIFALGNFSNF